MWTRRPSGGGLANSSARTWPSPRRRWRQRPVHSSDLSGYKSRGSIWSRCCSLLLGVVQFLAQFRSSLAANRVTVEGTVTQLHQWICSVLCIRVCVRWSIVGLSRGSRTERYKSRKPSILWYHSHYKLTRSNEVPINQATMAFKVLLQFFKSAQRKLTCTEKVDSILIILVNSLWYDSLSVGFSIITNYNNSRIIIERWVCCVFSRIPSFSVLLFH